MSTNFFENKKRIVIKIGSSLLVENGLLRKKWLENFAKNIASLAKNNLQIIIVSSGAIALGRQSLINATEKLSIAQKQAAASIGQIQLMANYQNAFAKNNLKVAQILLTSADCNARQHYLNCQNTIETLLKNKIIPIINENDSVAFDEIKVGDNDRLAARVAQMIDGDLLILFSDIDGLYTSNPKTNKNSKLIKEVFTIDKEIENMAGGAVSKVGTGGMITKILAAKMLNNSFCDVVITSAVLENSLQNLFLEKQNFTIFYCAKQAKNARKKWLTGQLNLKNGVVVNVCASEALQKSKISLLMVGVSDVVGAFKKGEVIAVFDENKKQIASGISNYSSSEVLDLKGKKTQEIQEILGKTAKKMLIHADNLMVIK
jgi:glutamate 5-kinase